VKAPANPHETMANIADAVASLARAHRRIDPFGETDEDANPDIGLANARMVEALLFATPHALDIAALGTRLPEGTDIGQALATLKQLYAGRGVTLVEVAGKWAFRTAPDLAWLMNEVRVEPRRLSRAALETLAVIAYHQPCTRPEVEEIRGVAVSKGTLDVLIEMGWVRPRGRRRAPGKPLTFGTTEAFLIHFGLGSLDDLPGKEDLKAAGLLDARLPPDFDVPRPSGGVDSDEDALDLDGPDFHQDFMAG